MKTVIQKVEVASVKVNNKTVSEINKGLLVLIGFAPDDTEKDIKFLINKIVGLRIFEDSNSKMNLNVEQVNGQILIVPQFTLYGKCLRGLRPDFTEAADIKTGRILFDKLKKFCLTLNKNYFKFGLYQEHMKLHLCNNGPVTIIIESKDKIKRSNTATK
jgi:D-tyrosyl-tRNA(Tyr) deacylase